MIMLPEGPIMKLFTLCVAILIGMFLPAVIAMENQNFECVPENPVFDGSRVIDCGVFSAMAPEQEFTVLVICDAEMFKPGEYSFAVKRADGKNNVEWAIYHAGWNNRFGFFVRTDKGELFVHTSPGKPVDGEHRIAGVFSGNSIRLYCDGKLVAEIKDRDARIKSAPGKLFIGAADEAGHAGFSGKIRSVKIIPKALREDEIQTAFGTWRSPKIKVINVPIAAVDVRPANFEPQTAADRLTGLMVVDWRIAPEADANEIRQIVRVLAAQGFEALFVSGAFRYLFAKNYGDRDWWTAIPWVRYQKTAAMIAQACHEAGLKFVLHLTACLGLNPDVEQEFKDMLCVSLKDGKPIDWPNYHGRPLCPNNPEFRKKYTGRLAALLSAVPLDGLMIDEVCYGRGEFSCGCQYCREGFQKAFGTMPPNPMDAKDWQNSNSKLWRDWTTFRCDSVNASVAAMLAELQKTGSDKMFLSCNCNPTDLNLPKIAGYNPLTLPCTVSFYENEPFHPWSWRKSITEGQWFAAAGHPILMQGYAPTLSLQYLQVLQGAVMNWGVSQWAEFCDFQTVPVNWFERWKPLCWGNKPLTNIAIVINDRDNMYAERRENRNLPLEYYGWAQAMLEAHIPFEVILSRNIEQYRRFQLLIVPDTRCWNNEELHAVSDFLKLGGRVIATGEAFQFGADGARHTVLPQFSGNITVISERRAEKYFMPKIGAHWYGSGGVWYDERDPEAKKEILELIRRNSEPILETNLPAEVVIMPYVQHYRDYQGTIIRMLNLIGTRFKNGVAIPDDKDYEFIQYPSPRSYLTYGSQPEITIQSRPVRKAYLISPDYPAITELEYREVKPGTYRIAIPDLARFAMIYLATENDLIAGLKGEIPVQRTMPEALPFDFRYISIR